MTKKTGWTDSPGFLLGSSLVIVLVAGAAISWWANRGGANVERADVLPNGHAVVVFRPASLIGSDHRARLVDVDVETGVARAIVDDVGRFGVDLVVHGPAGGRYWFASGPTTLWSRPLDAIETRLDHDLSSHPELAAGFDPRWRTPTALIVRGRAGGEYTIDSKGAIEATDWTMNVIHWTGWAADGRTDLVWKTTAPLADGREANRDAIPLESGGFVVRNDGSPILVAAGGAAIAVGGDLGVPVGYPRVDRVGAIGAHGPVWTVSANELFGEPQHWDLWMERLSVRVLAVEAQGEHLLLVLHATDNDGGGELRFVTLDGATGQVVRAAPLAPLR